MAFQDLGSNKFSNQNLNAVGSEYASLYGHDVNLLVQKATNKLIFDAQPQQFLDLKLMNMMSFETVPSDEFFYKEMGYQRDVISANQSVGAVTYPSTQTFGVTSLDGVSTNTLIIYPNNQKGNIVDTDTSALTITVQPFTGDTLPAVVSGDNFSNQSSVDHTGSEGFAQYFRATTIERSNNIQMFNKAIRYDEMELHKLKTTGTTSNFLQMEKEAMFQQHRIDISNSLWNGQKGEVKTANGKVAKTTGGVFTSMLEAGSPNAVGVTDATLVDAFEDIVFQSEYGKYGATRFAFMTPEIHRKLSKAYKEEFTRYQPNDEIAMLNLKEVNLGSSNIVLIPFSRFKDQASFPASFRNRIVILDMLNIKPCQVWGERSGETPDFNSDGTPKRYKDIYVDCNFGVKNNNPLGHGWLDLV